ncbi:penicillin acylase family protein [Candidatus Uabimicrobium sp. HlEnr_7]|uniref:penicillin acylase family protein n=1 Tax=Candidatus Uabimicrobium helgolandensis TaxID=3095367 RepID=UPI0035577C31
MKNLFYKEKILFKRLKNGVLCVEANNQEDMYFGNGYAQAVDRAMQMILTRIIGQGRICELLKNSDATWEVDVFFRRMNWQKNAERELEKMSAENIAKLTAWCKGVNHALRESIPWEFRLLGIRVEPWEIKDSVLFMRMISYLNLQQSQAEMENLIMQLVQNSIPLSHLNELFPGQLEGIDIDLIKKVQLQETIVPKNLPWMPGISASIASNNWVIDGSKTLSGNPILANDPHLEGNRLPNVWQEVLLKCQENYVVGAGMPGIPGVLIGRNNNVSWGATYSFMDSLDSWVETCQDGRYFKDDQWHPFTKREETIYRKKKAHKVYFYENEHGILSGDPYNSGCYLATKWACSENTGALSLDSLFCAAFTVSTEEMMDVLGQLEVPFNWVIADHQNIAYQMSGLSPIRNWSGLYPADGRFSENDWQGFHSYKDLPRVLNPEQKYIVTANNDLNHLGKVSPINLCMGSYRANILSQILEKAEDISSADCIKMQHNLFSLQAKDFMKVLKPILDNSDAAQELREWNYQYDLLSKGAWLFEQFYGQLLYDVFATIGGETVFRFLQKETGIFVDFFKNFDCILLQKTNCWFAGKTQEQVFNDAYQKSIARLSSSEIKTWGSNQKIELTNIFFSGKFKWLFDYGPVDIPGGRATAQQGQIYQSGGRKTSFVPSLRVIVDMNTTGIMSHILGGPSDRRFSRYYTSEVDMWRTQRYKYIDPFVEDEAKFISNLFT